MAPIVETSGSIGIEVAAAKVGTTQKMIIEGMDMKGMDMNDGATKTGGAGK